VCGRHQRRDRQVHGIVFHCSLGCVPHLHLCNANVCVSVMMVFVELQCGWTHPRDHRTSRLTSDYSSLFATVLVVVVACLGGLQCFDAVGWATGRASGL